MIDVNSFQPSELRDLVMFLPLDVSFSFEGGRIVAVEGLEQIIREVDEATNLDGFLYPPMQQKQRADALAVARTEDLEWKVVPKTRRPALLHRLPASHFLELEAEPAFGPLREGDGAFLVHLAGYLFGHRMQFYNWWFDNRVPMKSRHNAYIGTPQAAAFFSRAYATWKTWNAKSRQRFSNALFMLRRGSALEWEWKRFLSYYMVLDALYKTAEEEHGLKVYGHPRRVAAMCKRYGLHIDAPVIREIVKLRNDLFHEALWAGGQPGHAHPENSWKLVDGLKQICERTIPALLGFETSYVATPWTDRQMVEF